MQILDNAELTRRLMLLEQAVMNGKSREVGNTYRSEDALNLASNTAPQVVTNTENIEKNSADIDYVAMMTDVEIPIES